MISRFDIRQYQAKTEAPPNSLANIDHFESDWHQAWSEPVRFRISKKLSIALAASGQFAPVLNPEIQLVGFFESRWHQAWSEPIRLPLRLQAGANLFNSLPTPDTPTPSNQLQGWFKNFDNPVWPKKGLHSYLQLAYAAPDRYLPPADVTITIDPTEINTDDIEMDVAIYDDINPPPEAVASANVTISEIAVNTEANVSFREREPD